MILPAFALLCAGCRTVETRTEWLPVTHRVYIAPAGSTVTAPPGRYVVSDDGQGPRREAEITLEYDAAILSKGRFYELFERALEAER